MAQYTINYLDGTIERVTADRSEYDVEARLFIFHGDAKPVALVPAANVRSIHHPDGKAVTG